MFARSVVFGFCLALGCFFGVSAQSSADSSQHVFKTDTFSIAFPVGWNLNTSGFGGTRLYLISPRYNGQRTTLALSTQNEQTCEVSGDSMLRINLDQLPLAIDNYTLISSRVFNQHGVEGFEVVFSGSQGGNPRKWKRRGFCSHNATYILTYTAVPENFEFFEKEADKIMGSLKFAE